ncbi:MAG: invasion associated locus B family protein, partial [Pseudomonadota bacterium]
EKIYLRLRLPHGIRLRTGIQTMVDGAPIAPPTLRTTGPAGLFARTEIGPSLERTLSQGETLTISFASINGASLDVPVPLTGFAAVMEKVRSP